MEQIALLTRQKTAADELAKSVSDELQKAHQELKSLTLVKEQQDQLQKQVSQSVGGWLVVW